MKDTPHSRVGFVGDITRVLFGTVFGQGITVLVAPIITRIYLPEVFGVAATIVSIAAIISAVSCLKYELAIMLPKRDHDSADILTLSALLNCLFTVLSYLLIFFFGDSLCRRFNASELIPFLHWIPLLIFLQGLLSGLNFWTLRKKRFNSQALSSIAASSTIAASRVGFGAAGFPSANSLILALLFGRAASIATLGFHILGRDRKTIFRKDTHNGIWKVLSRYRKFPLYSSWAGLIGTLSLEVPVLLLTSFFSQEIVGFYVLARRIIQTPISMISSTISKVFFQRMAERKGSPALANIVQKVALALVSLGAPPLIFFAILGKDIFSFVFGANWATAGIIAQIMAPWFFMVFVSSPVSLLSIVLEKQEISLILNIVLLITRIIFLIIGGIEEDLHLTITLFSLSGFLFIGLFLLYLLREVGIQLRLFTASAFKRIALSILFLAPAYILNVLSILDPMWILGVGVLGCSLYYLFIGLRDQDLAPMVNQFLNSVKARNNLKKGNR